MEEVIGSIPIRSTNTSNHLNSANVRRLSVCAMVCAMADHFADFGEGFHRCALGLLPDVTIPRQHLAARVYGNRHDG
jgi:hypothetical protein